MKKDSVEPTPLCLQFGGGQQYFLERLAQVPRQDLPTKRPGRTLSADSPEECLRQTLFDRWSRDDDLTTSFRWDAEEDSRWAMMAGDPTDTKYKIGTQHGANRLASVGLSAVTVVPVQRRTRVRVGVLGGAVDRGRFTFSWPIWREQASLSAIRAMLGHPELLVPRGLSHLGVEQVFTSRRIDDRSMNFTRALPLSAIKSERIEPQHRKRAR
ncbi:MAG: hypothetical protein KY459_14435 [Acidobacteria bacterium]|nr:hypothetical protein [Acidobacteriota bacterium]